MRLRALVVLPCVALACGAVPAALAQDQNASPQGLFRDVLLKDASTSSGVKRLLRTNAGYVSPAPVFSDLTGDGKTDAAVTVENGGAAGAVAAYVLTAEGSSSGPTLTVVNPIYARGDDVCCTRKATERDYAWDAAAKAFKRTAMRTVTVGNQTPAPATVR